MRKPRLLSKRQLVRDKLDLQDKVDARTRELESAQLARSLELQHFAAFGRISAQLLHEVANPLTAASLSLEHMKSSRNIAVRQAYESLQELERYIEAARKQLRMQSYKTKFDTQEEIKQLLTLLLPIARKAGVKLDIRQPEATTLYGDPVKFNQILANVIVNAIDAYKQIERDTAERLVSVGFHLQPRFLCVSITDRASGINSEHLPHIFDAFYSTKHDAVRGLGIGLSMVKHTIEHDFGGRVEVRSHEGDGTTFRLYFLLQHDAYDQTSEVLDTVSNTGITASQLSY